MSSIYFSPSIILILSYNFSSPPTFSSIQFSINISLSSNLLLHPYLLVTPSIFISYRICSCYIYPIFTLSLSSQSYPRPISLPPMSSKSPVHLMAHSLLHIAAHIPLQPLPIYLLVFRPNNALRFLLVHHRRHLLPLSTLPLSFSSSPSSYSLQPSRHTTKSK